MSSVDRSDVQLTWASQKTEMEKMIQARDHRIAQKDAEIEALKLENAELGRRAEDSGQKYRESKQELQATTHAQAQLEEMQQRCRRLEKELDKSKKLLDSRAQELSVAQAFMTTADHYSIADVSNMVEQLNDEFFQCAMDMSDALLQHRDAPSATDSSNRKWRDILEDSCRLVAGRWNDDALARLETDIAQDDTVMFECIVQNAFVIEFQEIIGALCFDNKEIDRYLRNLWKAVLTSRKSSIQIYLGQVNPDIPTLPGPEEMPIAKNWLAITTAASTGQTRDHSQLMRYLYALLVVAGWREPPDSKVLEHVARKRIVDMTAKAGKIRDMIFRGILSTDVEVFSYKSSRDFDSATMQDAYEVPERPGSTSRVKPVGGGPIVCSTGLGLRYVIRRPNSTSSGSRREVVLKSKVLLHSTSAPMDKNKHAV